MSGTPRQSIVSLWLLAALLLVPGANSLSHSVSSRGVTVIAGATGYIGKSVVRESIQRGYKTYALVRNVDKVSSAEGGKLYGEYFKGAEIVQCDVSDPIQIARTMETITKQSGQIHSIVSCLASRSGIKKEAFEIDYKATLNCMEAGISCNARHFVLLSAICVRKPLLQFQLAKLKFEDALRSQTSMSYTIVRPTAFFKSVSGQMERLQEGHPFLMFDENTRCNPIAESDLATYLVDSITEGSRRNKVINLGGPDRPLRKIEQGRMLFKSIETEPKFSRLPVEIFDVAINALQFLADLLRNEQLENAAELGRIGKYYAVEDMVTTSPEEMYGTMTLQEHFNRISKEGQEYDPYTTMTGILGLIGDDGDKHNTEPLTSSRGTSLVEESLYKV